METRQKGTNVVMSLLALAGLLWLFSLATAGNLEPSASPGPTMKTLNEVQPRMPIGPDTTPGDSDSTYRITQPGSYYLTGNFTSNFKHGIEIDADDVAIDLMGYRVYSSWCCVIGANLDFDGIYIVPGCKNIEIRDGSIVSRKEFVMPKFYEGFRHGIYAPDDTAPNPDVVSHFIRIINVRVIGCRGNGMLLMGRGHLVKDCCAERNTESGFLCHRSSDSIFTGNIARENGVYGMSLGANSLVTNNSVNHNDATGIFTQHGCLIDGNTANNNGGSGNIVNSGGTLGLNNAL